jgi:hypothetical protein
MPKTAQRLRLPRSHPKVLSEVRTKLKRKCML